MPLEHVNKDEAIKAAKLKVQAASHGLHMAQQDLAKLLRADDAIEELARRLWTWEAIKEMEGEDEEWDEEFAQELRTTDSRNERWQTLTIDSEKDEWRDRAREVLELAADQRLAKVEGVIRLLHECDGQLGLGVHREANISTQWVAEANGLISRIREAIRKLES